MNTNIESKQLPTNRIPTFKATCLSFCQKVVNQIRNVKERLETEYLRRLGGEKHALRLALNEAEALAFETDFPHLVFPELAVEKLRAFAIWNQHQQNVHRGNVSVAFAS